MPTRRELKQNAKTAMRGHKPSVYLIALVYFIILLVLEGLTYRLMYPGRDFMEVFMQIAEGQEILEDTSFGSSLFQFAIGLMTTTLQAGFAIVCLNISRGVAAGFGELFDGFAIFFKVIWLNIVMSIYIALWTMLFIIPGIIATYRYSMAIFILLDDPELSVGECLRRSSELMAGHKWEYFVLELSFIGWNMLTVIPFVNLFVMSYTSITYANFYNALIGYVPGAQQPTEPVNDWHDREPWE